MPLRTLVVGMLLLIVAGHEVWRGREPDGSETPMVSSNPHSKVPNTTFGQ